MNKHYYQIGDDFIFEPDRYRLLTHNKETQLSQKETELLVLLCKFSLAVVERSHLLSSIWGNSESGDIGLNKNILMLRRKFESLGVKNPIKTVPRIGYMLLLEVKAISPDNTLDIIIANNEIENNLEKKTSEIRVKGSKDKHNILFKLTKKHIAHSILVSCTIAFSILYLFSGYMSNNLYRLIDSVDKYEGSQGILLVKKYIDSNASNENTQIASEIDIIFKQAPVHAKYFIMASKDNISIVWRLLNNEYKQANFLVDHGSDNFQASLLCAVNNIINNNQLTMAPEIDNNSIKYVSMRFFGNCKDKDYLLDLNVKRSGHPDKIKTVLQHFDAKNSQGTPLFHFDRTTERQQINYPDGSHQAIFKNSPASFNIDAQELVGNNDKILKIISEFTSSETTQTVIDSTNGVFMSDVMGGLLYLAN